MQIKLKSHAKNVYNLVKSHWQNAGFVIQCHYKNEEYSMERLALNKLVEWKNFEDKNPLIIRGARQVGKTWLMQEFGKRFYKKTAYINFDNNKNLCKIFEEDYNIERIILALQVQSNEKIDRDTLIIFDEIQECPKALTSLKYFSENNIKYNVIAAGSLLGVATHEGTGFPVGKVDFVDLYPLNFVEFAKAMGEEQLIELVEKKDYKMMSIFKNRFETLLKQYCYIGGMPAVVMNFIKNKDFSKVRTKQKSILNAYEEDFSKHIPSGTVEKTRLLWKSVPAQLSKENKKFIYGAVKEGARAKDLENAMSWLLDSGLIYKLNRISKPDLPLIAYEDFNAFKLFALDVGLLGAMTNLKAKTMIEGNKIFEEFKGAIAEQYVLQQFKSMEDIPIFYWTNSGGTAEIDFVVQIEDSVVPIEVKATTNLQAKSLKVYMEKYKPDYAIRTSMADYKKTENLIDLPLYTIEKIAQGDIK